jgi:hypothetical protein
MEKADRSHEKCNTLLNLCDHNKISKTTKYSEESGAVGPKTSGKMPPIATDCHIFGAKCRKMQPICNAFATCLQRGIGHG